MNLLIAYSRGSLLNIVKHQLDEQQFDIFEQLVCFLPEFKCILQCTVLWTVLVHSWKFFKLFQFQDHQRSTSERIWMFNWHAQLNSYSSKASRHDMKNKFNIIAKFTLARKFRKLCTSFSSLDSSFMNSRKNVENDNQNENYLPHAVHCCSCTCVQFLN